MFRVKVFAAPNSNLVHENREYSFHGLICYHLTGSSTERYIFLHKKLTLINIEREKYLSRGLLP